MRVLLISANTERISTPPLPLGLACVGAGCRKAGHEVLLVNLMFEGDPLAALRDSIAAFRPGVIGISVRNIDDQNCARPRFLLPPVREIVEACRALSDAPIVLGGAGYSIFPESALEYLGADMGIRGEGELAFPALLERLAGNGDVSGLPGLYLPGRPAAAMNPPAPIDDLPLPEPEFWIPPVPDRTEFWIPVQGKRGCPMLCSYCSTRHIQGTTTRKRSPEPVVNWLERTAARGFRKFVFVDSTFNSPPGYAKDLCRAIIRRGLDVALWCIVYPKWVDHELVELMARAGASEVSIGFESGSDEVLASYNKRFSAAEVAEVSRMFADAGVRRAGFLLLGGPGETRETVERSLAFADSLKLDTLKLTVGLRIYPATQLAARAVDEGLIRTGEDLLEPRFYLKPELRDWLPQCAEQYAQARPWIQ